MNEIQLFKDERFGEVRVAGTSEEPLFCLADVCKAIGIANPRNVKDRLEEDDVRQVDTIDTLGRTQQVNYVTESGLYDVIIRSDSENAKPFRKWVTSEVLPSIRKHGSYSMKPQGAEVLSLRDRLAWVKAVKGLLRLNDASTLGMLQKIAAPNGLPMPDYVPSKGVLKSATELLEAHGTGMTAKAFNLLAEKAGYVSTQERRSLSKGHKRFKAITEKGRAYGENQVSPHNPRETQPLWYADKFGELLGKLGIASIKVNANQ